MIARGIRRFEPIHQLRTHLLERLEPRSSQAKRPSWVQGRLDAARHHRTTDGHFRSQRDRIGRITRR
jgi:hypothetical protein